MFLYVFIYVNRGYNNIKCLVNGIKCDYTRKQIFDVETRRLLGVNESGEVCIRGNGNMAGYLNNDQATLHTIDNKGWLHSGTPSAWSCFPFFTYVIKLR